MNIKKNYLSALTFSLTTFRLITLLLILTCALSLKAQSYCTPSGLQNTDDNFYISNFSLTTINNSSLFNNPSRYRDNTSTLTISATIEHGKTYNFSLKNNKTASGAVASRIWIDYNNDGDFNDVNEEIWDSSGASNNGDTTQMYTNSFTVPTTGVIVGSTRIRIASAYLGATIGSSCNFPFLGEVEDYTVNISANTPNYCEPVVTNGDANHFINRFRFETIDNTTGNNGYSYYNSPIVNVEKGLTYNHIIDVNNNNDQMGYTIWIDYNRDGIFNNTNERVWGRGAFYSQGLTNDTSVSGNITISPSAAIGKTRMRVGFRRYWYPTDACDGDFDGNPGEIEDYVINITIDPSAPPEIDVLGNGLFIDLGAADAGLINNTNYGLFDIGGGVTIKSFKITNNGAADLNLTGTPPIQVLDTGDGSSVDFYIANFPNNLVIPSGSSEVFDVVFDPSVVGIRKAIISIPSNDPSDPVFQFTVEGEGSDTFPDTDGDGVSDNLDVDDDNDGLLDSYENASCLTYANAGQSEVIYLNEDFGSGITRTQISTQALGGSSYCYEDGSGTGCTDADYSPTSLNDGEYTIHHTITNGDGVRDPDVDVDIAKWAEDYWYTGPDHTGGDTNGRMAIINATEEPGIFYGNEIRGVTVSADINYSFWALNIDRTDAPDVSTRKKPQIAILIFDPFFRLIKQQISPLLQPTDVANPNGDWVEISGSFTTQYTSFIFVLVNVQPGGIGNDLAIDDIIFKQSLCDLDKDGIADILDLDNDNDGIPNVIELGLQDNDHDATVNYDGTHTWSDTNKNGLHDDYENVTPRDTDNDGVPDYNDLDSDNDGIFDNVEYDGHGDVDVSGDGVGVGLDIIDPATDQDGDGILPIVDLNDDGIGNDHGSSNYPDPLDDDNDGIPNYLDPFSNDATNNPANGSDISTTIYASYDSDNDGVIDGTTDTDRDGVLDAFDTNDTDYGSPRDLDNSYTLFFDGRNDYVEDTAVLSGLANATLMSWIKIEPGASGSRKIVGQDNFSLQLDTSGQLSATANGATATHTTALPENIWVHVAAVYDSTNGLLKLYVNGEEEVSRAIAGSLSTDASNLTIGRRSNTNSNYFEGQIDEIRIFNKALTEDELQKMVYQELDDTDSFKKGAIIPYDINVNLGSSLLRYFKMDGYKDDILDNKTTNLIDQGSGAKIYNIKNIYHQTAPLPYETSIDGDWSNTATWLHGDVWDITNETSNKDWSIVHIKSNTTTSKDHTNLGLILDANNRLDVTNDNELKNTWYLNLQGLIDLKGESQLVQTENSELIVGISGRLERDQQGTENLFTYNYWSSPVHSSNPNGNVDGDETYTVAGVLNDATDVNNLSPLNYTSGYDGSNTTSPITISNFWLYKFDNRVQDDYSEWQFVGENGTLKVGEGYSMKGPGSGPISDEQNYAFVGKPNNGTITLNTAANNEYLVGNPYPSAIDAYEFILDNPHLDGTLYFWEHYGGGSHILREYQGGYGMYNLSGGTPPLDGTAATADPDVDPNGTALKIPKRYIPVSQGFFVKANTTGDTTFENDQRLFVPETGGSSIFYRTHSDTSETTIEDTRRKLRIGYKSPKGYKRQLLLTEDENATINADWSFDGLANEESPEDMYWNINNDDYIIQAIGSINEKVILPLNIKTKEAGIIEINIDSLQYINEDVKIYLNDNGIYHNLRASKYITTVNPGETKGRFEIVFTDGLILSNDTVEIENDLSLFFENTSNKLTITNPKQHLIKAIETINMLGQIVFKNNLDSDLNKINIPMNLPTGSYIFKIKTENRTVSMKAIINN